MEQWEMECPGFHQQRQLLRTGKGAGVAAALNRYDSAHSLRRCMSSRRPPIPAWGPWWSHWLQRPRGRCLRSVRGTARDTQSFSKTESQLLLTLSLIGWRCPAFHSFCLTWAWQGHAWFHPLTALRTLLGIFRLGLSAFPSTVVVLVVRSEGVKASCVKLQIDSVHTICKGACSNH